VMVVTSTSWDGTTPKLDIGAGGSGLFAQVGGAFELSNIPDLNVNGVRVGAVVSSLAARSAISGQRVAPSFVESGTNIKLWVSQDGLAGGAEDDSTHGVTT